MFPCEGRVLSGRHGSLLWKFSRHVRHSRQERWSVALCRLLDLLLALCEERNPPYWNHCEMDFQVLEASACDILTLSVP